MAFCVFTTFQNEVCILYLLKLQEFTAKTRENFFLAEVSEDNNFSSTE